MIIWLVSLLPYKDVINNLCLESEGWDNKSISTGEWALMEGACTVLESVKKLTKELEGEKEPTINKVVDRLYTTHTELDRFIINPENAARKKGVGFAKTLKKKLKERFPDYGTNLDLLRKANYLDPRFRGLHLESVGRLESTKDDLENLWNETEGEPEEVDLDLEHDGPMRRDLSPTSLLRQRIQMRSQSQSQRQQTKIRKEMIKYESLSHPAKTTGILAWWNFYKNMLPILSSLARMILAIPASSAKSERTFSTCGNFVTQKRTRLAPNKIEELVITKENLKKVEIFKKDTNYTIKHMETNPFKAIEMNVEYLEESLEDSVEEDDYDTDMDDSCDNDDSTVQDSDLNAAFLIND